MHALEPGVDITDALFPRGYDTHPRHESEIPPHFIQYCVGRPDGMWLAPERFNAMDTGWRLNHSTTPNVLHGEVEGPDGRPVGLQRFVVATGGLAAGDELFIDYMMLGEPPEVQRAYYRRETK